MVTANCGNKSNPFSAILPANMNKPPIKFQLKTEFDFRVIDLVYNHSFNLPYSNQCENQFENLNADNITPPFNDPKFTLIQSVIFGKLYQEISVVVPPLLKDNEMDLLASILKLPEAIPLPTEFGLYCLRIGIPAYNSNQKGKNHLLNTNLENFHNTLFSKEDLVNYLRTNMASIDKDELKLTLALAQKHNEL
jgi:hypothetical protein